MGPLNMLIDELPFLDILIRPLHKYSIIGHFLGSLYILQQMDHILGGGGKIFLSWRISLHRRNKVEDQASLQLWNTLRFCILSIQFPFISSIIWLISILILIMSG